jgi:hypothetical protein
LSVDVGPLFEGPVELDFAELTPQGGLRRDAEGPRAFSWLEDVVLDGISDIYSETIKKAKTLPSHLVTVSRG